MPALLIIVCLSPILSLQVYKSMGAIKEAKEMYDRYAEVSGSWATWRQIVVDRRQPRSILVQANTSIKDEKLDLHSYEASAEGFVRYDVIWSESRSKE